MRRLVRLAEPATQARPAARRQLDVAGDPSTAAAAGARAGASRDAPRDAPEAIRDLCGPTTYFGSAADANPALKTLKRAESAPAASAAPPAAGAKQRSRGTNVEARGVRAVLAHVRRHQPARA
jgi:hypothetical protein